MSLLLKDNKFEALLKKIPESALICYNSTINYRLFFTVFIL